MAWNKTASVVDSDNRDETTPSLLLLLCVHYQKWSAALIELQRERPLCGSSFLIASVKRHWALEFGADILGTEVPLSFWDVRTDICAFMFSFSLRMGCGPEIRLSVVLGSLLGGMSQCWLFLSSSSSASFPDDEKLASRRQSGSVRQSSVCLSRPWPCQLVPRFTFPKWRHSRPEKWVRSKRRDCRQCRD